MGLVWNKVLSKTNYACTDLSRISLSLLLCVVMVDARVTQLGLPLLWIERIWSWFSGYSKPFKTLCHWLFPLSIQYWYIDTLQHRLYMYSDRSGGVEQGRQSGADTNIREHQRNSTLKPDPEQRHQECIKRSPTIEAVCVPQWRRFRDAWSEFTFLS